MDPSQFFHVCSQLPAEKAKGSLPGTTNLQWLSQTDLLRSHTTTVVCSPVSSFHSCSVPGKQGEEKKEKIRKKKKKYEKQQ
ncbi:Oxysterol-Binding Protein-Related Protein 11 [Manis pentadactyla]|nr:Oxysterol-Binding Protein-Related Protein 11 [Manis pentadactyla]